MQDNKNTFSGTEDLDEIRRLIGSDAPESSDDLSLDDILTEFGDEPAPEVQPEPEAPRHARPPFPVDADADLTHSTPRA